MEKLFEALRDSGQYTKSFSDFQSQFGSQEGQEKLYGALKESGSYTKTFGDFTSQFFNTAEPVKTNDSASADPAVESNQNATGSKSEDGSSEDLTYLNVGLGLMGTVVDAWKSGFARADLLPNALKVYNDGADMDEKEYEELVANTKMQMAQKADPALVQFQKDFMKLSDEHGYFYAFAKAASTPSGIKSLVRTHAESLALQAKTGLPSFLGGVDLDAEDNAALIGSTAAGYGAGAVMETAGNWLLKQKGWQAKALGLGLKAIGKKGGTFGGFMGGTSRTMEKGFTTVELLNEAAAEKYGKAFTEGTDDERISIYKKIQNDKPLFDEIKSKAIARGNTIGFVDGVTGMLTLPIAKTTGGLISGTKLSKLAGAGQLTSSLAAESVGGGLSEYYGQKAAGQEIDPFEIGLEAVGDKVYSFASVPQAFKTPSYSINGEKMNGAQFSDALKLMDDAAYAVADIKIDNSPVAEKIVNDRRQNIAVDQKVDSRINDVTDRGNAIKLTKEINFLKNNKEGNKNKILQAQTKLDNITKKYENSTIDATIEQRQKAVADAVENKFEAEFNKNYKAAQEGGKKIGLDSLLFTDTNSYLKAIEDAFGYIPEGANTSEGVFAGNGKLFVNKEAAKAQIDIATGKTGSISVASHEVLHPIFNALIGNEKTQGQFVKNFRTKMTSKQKAYVDRELKSRGYSKADSAIELMNIFSDGIIKGDITYDQTFFEKIKDIIISVFRGEGFNNLSFDSGRDVYNFLKEYNTSIKDGKLSDKAIDVIKKAETKKGVKVKDAKILQQEQFSKTQLENTKKKLSEIPADQVQSAVNRNKIGAELPSMIGTQINNRFSNLDPSTREEFTFDVLEKILRPNKQGANKDLQWDGRGDLYGFLNGRIGLRIRDAVREDYNRPEAERMYVGRIDAKQIEDLTKEPSTEPTTEPTPKKKSTTSEESVERGQATFDELDIVDDDLVKDIKSDLEKEIRVRVQKGTLSETVSVKKGRNTYVVSWLENYINKQLFKKLLKKLGAISGTYPDTIIPPAYIDFLQDPKTFDIITKALPIKSIKKSYGKLFEIEKVGRELTPEGNPIFRIKKIDKPKFFKYFVDGKKSTVLERQKQLFREILTPVAKQVVADYATPENIATLKEIQSLAPEKSVDIVEDIVIDAQLNLLEAKLDRYKGEQAGFDIIQFSKYDRSVVTATKVKNAINLDPHSTEFLTLDPILQDAVTWVKESLQLKGTTLGGLIYEILTISRVDNNAKSAKLPIEVKTFRGTANAGFDSNRPDIVLIRKNKDINVELKQTAGARFGQTTLGVNFESKEPFSIRSKRKNEDGSLQQMTFESLPTGKQLKKAMDKSQEHLKGLLSVINKSEKENFTSFPLGKSISIKTVEKIKKSRHYKALAKISTKADGKTVADHYNAKDTHLLQVGGKGMFLLGEDIYGLNSNPNLTKVPNISDLEFTGVMRIKFNYNRKAKTASLSLISEPVIKNKKDVSKSPITLDSQRGLVAFNNRIQFSKGKYAFDPFDMADVVTMSLFGNTKEFKNKQGFERTYKYLTPEQKTKVRLEMAKHKLLQFSKSLNKAKAVVNKPNAPIKGISVWDFDDTLATTKSNVLYTLPDGTKGKINATEFALNSDKLSEQGAIFDFSEFSKVMQGAKGPMFNKAVARNEKFGNENVYILTARPADSKYAIHEFLKGIGLNIKLDNIVGLGDGTAIAKAKWVVDKVAEGYNDFYFADDAYKNVKAVQEVLVEADVKSKVHQAKVQFSKNLNKDFNDIIQDVTGVSSSTKVFEAASKVIGKTKDKFKFFVPYSAEDFVGLLYPLMGKGKQGDAHAAWFKEALLDPYAKGYRDFESYKQNATAIVKQLVKSFTDVPSGLEKTNSTGFTNEMALRVILWAKNGHEIPGLSKQERSDLIKVVQGDQALLNFAKQIQSTLGSYPEPTSNWYAGTITTDAINMINTSKRAEFLEAWQQNVDVVFSKDNMNKLRLQFGENYTEALEDMLYRMKTGRNRPIGANKLTNNFMNWVNDAVGTIMFFNTRSALLQTLSIVNFVNWGDNNPIAAAEAFANQDQFWKDFSMLFNSDFLKQRRSGLKNDVNADDIARAAETANNKYKAALSAVLKAGFLPTQIADSFAIAMGGASFVRNRINTYVSQGMSEKQAKEKALLEFQEIAEETQQSSRPDRVSQQQASPLGRIILAFANTPMQYMRLTKKAVLDLKNGRGDYKTNITKIIYYTTVQNMIFSSLQSAMFASLFEDDDEEMIEDKQLRAANSMLDSLLRGTGVYGAIASTIKNILFEVNKQSKKDRPDYTQAGLRMLSISPPVDSKIRKVLSTGRAFSYKTTREKMVGFGLDNPAFYAIGQSVSAFTNIPLDRVIRKMDNVRMIFSDETKYWQKVALLLGYSQWDLGLVQKKDTQNKFGKTSKWKKR